MLRRHALVALVLLLPLALAPTAEAETREVRVRLDGLAETVALVPFDPRAPELAARDGAANGMWTGRLASGGLVRLVEGPGYAVALVQTGPAELAWATLEAGALVPLAAPLEPTGVDTELRAPEGAPSVASVVDAQGDGKVQLLLDADRSFARTFGANADEMQLAIVALVDAIYQANLGVEIEVVEQHVWDTDAPLTGKILCSGGPDDLLRQFRDHYETTRPTVADAREEALVLTTKTPAPHPSGGTLIGCGYIYELESPWAYASARIGGTVATQGLDLPQNVLLVAHEMGHNFGGLHHRAMPTPDGSLDRTRCNGSTIMYPYLCRNAPAFSDARGLGLLEGIGLVREGGNAPHMREFAHDRI